MRTFGIELEIYNVDRTELVRKLRDAGIPASLANYTGRDYSIWQIKTDCSINGYMGCEVVSRVLTMDDLPEVDRVVRILNELGAKVNRSCGMHIHWGVRDWDMSQWKNFAKRYVKFERGIDQLMPISRRLNNARYCQSVCRIESVMAEHFRKIDQARDLHGLSMNFNYNQRNSKVNMTVFHRSGTVEIRHHSGTVNATKILNWIAVTYAMVTDATNKTPIKPTSSTDARKLLDTMLDGMVRRGTLHAGAATFYKRRATKLERAINRNATHPEVARYLADVA